MKKKALKVAAADDVTFLVFRSSTDKNPDSITGAGLTVDINSGSLLVSANGVVIYIYGPEQWVTVNQSPI
jgi:hypothetical protein